MKQGEGPGEAAASSQAGHRARLRSAFREWDSSARTDEALLELLLTYSIPRQDVRPLAKALLDHFGTLPAVLEAKEADLESLPGLGEGTAFLLRLVSEISRLRGEDHRGKHKHSEPTANALTLPLFSELTEHPGGEIPVAPSPPPSSFALLPPSRSKAPVRSRRRVPGEPPVARLFTTAVLREAIDLVPRFPHSADMDELRTFLVGSLHFSSIETRQRYAAYILSRLFPAGTPDQALLRLASSRPGSATLRDACLYRFAVTEPLVTEVVERVLRPALGAGAIPRARLREFLAQRFPESGAVRNGGKAMVEALAAGRLVRADRQRLTVRLREVPLASFVFVLHSELPEPGMYDIDRIESSPMVRTMLWRDDQVLPSLYELRNRNGIAKLSEIDSVRQVTTRFTLDEAVEWILAEGIS